MKRARLPDLLFSVGSTRSVRMVRGDTRLLYLNVQERNAARLCAFCLEQYPCGADGEAGIVFGWERLECDFDSDTGASGAIFLLCSRCAACAVRYGIVEATGNAVLHPTRVQFSGATGWHCLDHVIFYSDSE